ncbi:MAG: YicC family protein [Candidatus Hydrogenedentes bacterium]|nr:YicC family protein [Candidatus Hydrogenedentota bacterium]
MLRSMTGFGRSSGEFDGDTFSVELSAVNHRYLDASVRLPYAWASLEPIVKETVRKRISRGKINLTITRKRGAASRGQTVYLDTDIARQYVAAARELIQLLGTMESLRLDTLAQLEGVFYHEEPEEDLDRVQVVVVATLEGAIERLNEMRLSEGKALAAELENRVDLMRQALAVIEERLPELNTLYEQRLRARIDELKADSAVTEDRIALEIALMADKGDVTEEVVRIRTHLDHVFELLAGEESVGRELNFLAQELQREINTLGSKVRDASVTREVLRLKSDLERFREQIQNVE